MQIEDSYPLSPLQHGLLVHSLSAPQSGVYIQQLVAVLREELNVSALQRAWDQVLRRHAALRTSFFWEGTEPPVQQVHRDIQLPLKYLDWSDRTLDEQEKQLESLLQTDRQLGFHLDQAPLMRLTLLRCGQAEYRLIWTSHHALFDGRSRVLLLNEVFAFYEAICRGNNLSLSNPPPYRSYIDWLQKQNTCEAENFWRTRLKDLNAEQSLAGNHRQSIPQQVQSYGEKTARLSKTDTRGLRSMVGRYQLTPNTLLQGAWALLLSRYSGENDVVFGATRAGRHAAFEGANSVVGLLINTVPVPVRVSPNIRLLPFLQTLRSQWTAMRDFEHTPLVKIHEWSPVPSGKPLFESLLVFENYQLNALMHEQGDRWNNREFHLREMTHYPLTVAGYLGPDLSLEITYDQQRFDDDTITRMLNHLLTLLVEMVRDPNRKLLDIPLLSPSERHQLLYEWNENKTDYPKDQCIHELFETQVEKTPDAIALVCEDQQLTYRELNRRANQLAHYLHTHGVGPDELVGICVDCSIDMIVGLLGIVKAGGAYVPLDPTYPNERLRFMLQDSGARVLIVQHAFVDLFDHTATIISLDTDWEKIGQGSERNLEPKTSSNSLAYVVYTSGSTGRPKGVAVSHQAVNRLVINTDYVQVTPSEAIAQASNVSFDAATFEIWGALLNGARLVLIAKDTLLSPQSLSKAIERHGISTLFLTTALFNQMVEQIPAALGKLRSLLFGGEAVDPERVKELLRNSPPSRLLHVYGPTETTTFATWYWVKSITANAATVPIGRPIANTETYILDNHLTPVPIGVCGELYIGGPGLARRYLNHPELTTEKFIEHPFSNDLQARLYKTGDRARYLADGNIEFFGRIDDQVKIRGYRIELGEIEAVLAQHPAIQQAVVLAREDNPGDRRLVAYTVAVAGSAPSAHDLRSFLQLKLPDNMVPSAYIFLDSLPLTPNGKLDRKVLPAPDHSRADLDDAFAVPTTPVEEILATIWAEILKLDKVGIHDNFFHLGGHSLIATQVVSRINKAFQIDFPLRRLFESPTIASLADSVQASMGIKNDSRSFQPNLPVPRSNATPLSFAQERLWFLECLDPGNATYKIPAAFRLAGDLNLNALEQSLNEVVRRHEALRTVFAAVNGNPVQKILRSLVFSLTPIDLSELPAHEREPALQSLLEEEALQPFDLSRGPLIRSRLWRLAPHDHVLALNLHHIVSDGWSMGVLCRELSTLYQAYGSGKPSPLSELPIQYADYALWQRDSLQSENLDKQLSYWRKQLDGLSTLQLPTDHPRPALQTYRGWSHSIELSTQLTAAIEGLVQREGVTLFITLLAAFQTLLCRYCGQQDIAVGTPVAGRTRQETDGLIGLFVNTLVLRTDLSNNPTFKELLAQVSETTLEAYTHQDLPFEKLVEELHPERNPSISPLFQVMFAFQNAGDPSLELEGLSAVPIRSSSNIAKFDLSLTISDRQGSLGASLNYNNDLFDAATIERMLGHFQVLLEGIVANPDQPISEIPLLTEAEKHQIIVEWNDTKTDYPNEQCIHELFEAQVDKTPDAIALAFEDQQISYRELNNRSNQLAHYLQKLGVGPDVLVGICVERSIEMIVGLLGILKAGGAYLPIDPDLPRERIDFMLEDSRAAFLLTQAQIGKLVPTFAGARIIIDQDWQEIARESITNVGEQLDPDNLAYVIYTSGSTGKPKGVMIQHSSVVNFLASMARQPGLSETDILLAVTTFCFDIAGLEIYLPLTVGARVVLARRDVASDGLRLAQLLSDCGATAMQATPATWRMLLAGGWQGNRELKILCGGEALADDLAKQLVQRCASLWNMYGPTETTIYSAVQRVAANVSRVTLGQPIANTQIYLLDKLLNPVPIGVSGEMHIGGDGLARGYLGRPELSREKFLPDPFNANPASRVYKTGDLARYLPDGNIEFLGRMDHQVKIRGYRIELGEIEAVLGQHPAIREAAVLAREASPEDPTVSPGTDKRLVAYVVARPDTSPNELRSFLKRKLPEYMVPSAFMFLESLPLTHNGKLDRKALPAPEQGRPELEGRYVAPRTATEELLVAIAAGVLKVDQVGIHDNFFDLGGHSLLATQLISRIWEACRAEIPLRFLFESPTIAGLAERIEQVHGQGQKRPARPMFATDPQETIPLSFAQQRLWFLDQYEPNSSVYNIPSALRLKGSLDIPALEQSLNEIVRRHEALRTTFAAVDGEPVQLIAPALRMSVPITDLTRHPASDRENEADRLATELAREPFDLSQGPLFRVQLLRLGQDDHVLVQTMHHIVSDGWSRGVFYRELSMLYQAYTQGNPTPLSELPIQYADFAVWQRQWLQGEVLEDQLSYWRKQLAEAPALLHLPTDRPRPAVQSYRGAKQSTELSQELTQRLKALSARQGVTLFMTLLAAFQTLLYRYTGQTDIVVGSPIANRNRAEIEGLIGFFVNTLVLRTDLSGNPTFTELLTRVRETALGAYTHQDLPFEKLVEELHPQRSLSHSPLVQVLFNLLETQDDQLSLPGLDASPFGAIAIPSKFDLTLYAIPKPQRLTLTINYNSDLFDDTTINRMLRHLCNLLEELTSDCGRRLLELPLLAEDERRQLLAEWSGSETHPAEHRCIHQLFEAQVQLTPDAIALTYEQLSLTYRELNRRANQFARHLRTRGVATGDLIPIFMERCCDMVIAVLGILKAGAAYVPLDFDYPRMRLAYMLGDTRATLLVTSAPSLNRLPEYEGAIICFDRDRHLFESEVEDNPTWVTSAADLSYVYYTSGSTGTPKGVLTSHWGLARYCNFLADTYNLNSADSVLQLASFSFDASVRDMIAPLTVGARVVVVDQQGAKDPTVLISKINQHRITCLLSTVPPMLNELAETMLAEKRTSHDSLRLILVSGEPLHGSLCRKVHEAFGEKTLLVNQYGPTECTMTSSYHPISLADHLCQTVPIGRPIPHTKLYVLDDDLNPTPVGVEGELYISGEGLTVGYLNRSDLTAEKFVPHPYSNKPGERLYRTGDVVRYRSDGTFTFVGRRDGQVKIRSIRIELGEIQSVLGRHPKVREAVILAPENNSGEKQLVAYVVAEDEDAPAALDLRDFLKQQLPEYMVPAFFVFLPSLPRSPNGKVERKTLPAPDFKRREINETFAAPRSVFERKLVELAAEILKIDKVGIQDNLFDLGLHSLSATQLVSRVRTKLHKKLPLRHIFEAPTIAGLARLIETLADENNPEPSPSGAKADAELITKRVRNEALNSHPVNGSARPLSIERRSLLSLLAAGKIPPIDAAALSYLSEDLLQHMGLSRDAALYDWFDELPCVFGINETHLGRIANIGLPRLRSRLYDDQSDLVTLILEALEISHRIGARVVSLTGLLPSATNYGQAIADVISANDCYPLVTTGHATTVSAVVMTIERILHEAGKSLAEENVAFLGLGSIGYTTLRLMLHSLPHPKSITLCDIYSKLDHLKKVRDDIMRELKFTGPIQIAESMGKVPHEVYAAGLIVGATNVPDVLDIEQIRPGTVIVDDSAPHCFNADEAVQRFEAHEDILFTAGGVLRLPEPYQRTLYLPQRVQDQTPPAVLEAISKYNPLNIGGCVLSGLLTARYESLTPTLGVVDDASSKSHYQVLQGLGYQAAGLQCRGYTLPEESVRRFRKRFGYV
ncbi:MAG: amino acid adenylation domain-containing protein [Candidatus Binatia bacterium]